jgi:hypothetical protein
MCSEKVNIPPGKPCIVLEGSGRHLTTIKYGDHGVTDISATFTSSPDNVIAKGITFEVNTKKPVISFCFVFQIIYSLEAKL